MGHRGAGTGRRRESLPIAGAHQSMLQFSVGGRVRCDTPDGRWISGILTRYNEKTVTVLAEDGHHWGSRTFRVKTVVLSDASDNVQS